MFDIEAKKLANIFFNSHELLVFFFHGFIKPFTAVATKLISSDLGIASELNIWELLFTPEI